MNRKADRNSTEDSRANRVGEILKSRFQSHKIGYTHPATARRTQLIRDGWTVIGENVAPESVGKNYPEGSLYLTTGEVFAPPAKQQTQKDAA